MSYSCYFSSDSHNSSHLGQNYLRGSPQPHHDCKYLKLMSLSLFQVSVKHEPFWRGRGAALIVPVTWQLIYQDYLTSKQFENVFSLFLYLINILAMAQNGPGLVLLLFQSRKMTKSNFMLNSDLSSKIIQFYKAEVSIYLSCKDRKHINLSSAVGKQLLIFGTDDSPNVTQ